MKFTDQVVTNVFRKESAFQFKKANERLPLLHRHKSIHHITSQAYESANIRLT